MRPTTRKGRFLYYQAKFRRRATKQRYSKPYPSSYYRVGITGMNRPRGPWTYKNKGVMQASLHRKLKKPTNGAYRPPYVFTWVRFDGTGYGDPPHVRFQPTLEELGVLPNHHFERAFINFHNRPVQQLGHKLNRNNGFNRQCWWALNWYLACKRLVDGPPYWPPWDPLHRTPVGSEPPWG